MKQCLVCGSRAEIHHLMTRKAYPQYINALWNQMPLDRKHHVEIHKIGRQTFIKKYKLEQWMIERGWEVCDLTGKWIHTGD